MESVRVPENPKEKESIRGSTGEPEGQGIESNGVPENPKDKEWNPCEYGRTLSIRNGIRGRTGEPEE